MCVDNSGTLCQGRKWLAAKTGRERTMGESVWWKLAEEPGWRPFESLCLLSQHGLRTFWGARSKYVPPLSWPGWSLVSTHHRKCFCPPLSVFSDSFWSWQLSSCCAFTLHGNFFITHLYHLIMPSSHIIIFSLWTKEDTGYFSSPVPWNDFSSVKAGTPLLSVKYLWKTFHNHPPPASHFPVQPNSWQKAGFHLVYSCYIFNPFLEMSALKCSHLLLGHV